MSEDLVQAAKAAAELEPAIEAFAEATGALEPPREVTGWIAAMIRYRRIPHEAKLLMRAAERIKASGLPSHAVPDKTLRAILEDGPLEDDETMQERWANLLFNAATAKAGSSLKIAYPKILAGFESNEAQFLDKLFDKVPSEDMLPAVTFEWGEILDLVDMAGLYNLERLGLLRWDLSTGANWAEVAEAKVNTDGIQLTQLGWAFVAACREPEATP